MLSELTCEGNMNEQSRVLSCCFSVTGGRLVNRRQPSSSQKSEGLEQLLPQWRGVPLLLLHHLHILWRYGVLQG